MMNINSYNQSQRNSIPTNCNNSEDTTKNAFGPGGCPGLIDGRRCGETRNLDIIKEFNKLYAAKMKQIDDVAGGDCAQAKITLQQEWIKDLSEQNEMLVSVVEELEVEAADRVTMLEEKLQNSAKCACESEQLMKEKDRRLKEFEEKIRKMNETMEKNEEARRACQQYAELKKSMLDMRDALTAEVAEKHDAILCLRREVHLMEEQCRKAEQQAQFKDDIIKELRKEIKQLKLLRTKKSRSPRTIKKCEHRLIHPSRTDPDTNIHHFKEGTIVIKDTSVGDTMSKQVIKEKYADPSNQTVVYICEGVTRSHKNKNRGNSRMESRCSKPQEEEVRNCEVTQDDPCSRNKNISDNRDNSHEISLDYPRDASPDVTRDSPDNSMQNNFLVYPTIHETCIRYSKDILEMLNNHSLEEKKALEKYLIGDQENTCKSFGLVDGGSPIHEEECKLKFGEIKDLMKDEIIAEKKEGPTSFLSNTVSRCEKYLLNMYRKKYNEESDVEKGKCSGLDDSGHKDKLTCCYCNEYMHRNVVNDVPKYKEAVDHSPTRENEVKIVEIHVRNEKNVREHDISFMSSACQTVGFSQLSKNTQTSDSHLLNDSSSERSASYENLTESLLREDEEGNVFERDSIGKVNCQGVFPEDLHQKDRVNVEPVPTEELWNNTNMKSDEISFEESEIRAFSTPFYEDVQNYRQPDYIQARRRENLYPDQRIDEAELLRLKQEKRRLYDVPHVVPVRRYVLPPHPRQAKMLSPRTIRKIPSRKIYHSDVPLSVRSRSLPICAEMCAPVPELGKPIRVQKVKRQAHCAGGHCNYVDLAYRMEENGVRKKIVSNELRGFMEVSQRNRVCNSGGKRYIVEDTLDPWFKVNNTF